MESLRKLRNNCYTPNSNWRQSTLCIVWHNRNYFENPALLSIHNCHVALIVIEIHCFSDFLPSAEKFALKFLEHCWQILLDKFSIHRHPINLMFPMQKQYYPRTLLSRMLKVKILSSCKQIFQGIIES